MLKLFNNSKDSALVLVLAAKCFWWRKKMEEKTIRRAHLCRLLPFPINNWFSVSCLIMIGQSIDKVTKGHIKHLK